MRKLFLFFTVIISLLISSCSLHDDPRSMATTKISLTYDGNQCTPYESFVPQGQKIEISVINESEFDITWYLVFGPIDDKFEDLNPDSILASANGIAAQITKSTFIAPYLPARYDSFCVRDDDSDKRALTYLLVVQPYDE